MGFISHKPNVFGPDWSFTADLAKPDTAYTNLGIGLHTDATYYNQPMGIQIFHVLSHVGNGGETMLADGFSAIRFFCIFYAKDKLFLGSSKKKTKRLSNSFVIFI